MARCPLFADHILHMFLVSEAKLVEKGKDLAREHAVTLLVSAVAGGAKHIPELLGALIDVLLKWLQLAVGLF